MRKETYASRDRTDLRARRNVSTARVVIVDMTPTVRSSLLAVLLLLGAVYTAEPAWAGQRCFGEEPTIAGSNRSETLRGTSGRDVIVGRGGQDTIYGLGGDDLICGNGFYLPEEDDHGSDILSGGRGKDKIAGGKGDDASSGGPGDDLILAQGGSTGLRSGDSMSGGGGDDTLVGGPLGDLFYPGPGRDIVRGRYSEHGSDSVSYARVERTVRVDLTTGMATGEGRDRLSDIEMVVGSPFDDFIVGSDEANELVGGDGRDVLRGRGGKDGLFGQRGYDVAYGGRDRDDCVAEREVDCEAG